MEKTLELLNRYFELNNLKSFCEHYDLNYEFTRQVLQQKNGRVLTDKFKTTLLEKIEHYQLRQERIFGELNKLVYK